MGDNIVLLVLYWGIFIFNDRWRLFYGEWGGK